MFLEHSNVLLKKDEKIIYAAPHNISLAEEKTVSLGADYGGVSVRVMKGVSVRVGKAKARKVEQLVELDRGALTITNKRFIYSGKRQNRSFNLSAIQSIDSDGDFLVINRSGKTKAEYYSGLGIINFKYQIKPNPGETFKEVDLEYRFNGDKIRRLIQLVFQGDY